MHQYITTCLNYSITLLSKPLNLVHAYFSGYLLTVGHIRAEYVLFYSKTTIKVQIKLIVKHLAFAHLLYIFITKVNLQL